MCIRVPICLWYIQRVIIMGVVWEKENKNQQSTKNCCTGLKRYVFDKLKSERTYLVANLVLSSGLFCWYIIFDDQYITNVNYFDYYAQPPLTSFYIFNWTWLNMGECILLAVASWNTLHHPVEFSMHQELTRFMILIFCLYSTWEFWSPQYGECFAPPLTLNVWFEVMKIIAFDWVTLWIPALSRTYGFPQPFTFVQNSLDQVVFTPIVFEKFSEYVRLSEPQNYKKVQKLMSYIIKAQNNSKSYPLEENLLPSVEEGPSKSLNKDSGNVVSPFTSFGLLTNREWTAQTDKARVGTGENEMDPKGKNELDEPLLEDKKVALEETLSLSRLGRSISDGDESYWGDKESQPPDQKKMVKFYEENSPKKKPEVSSPLGQSEPINLPSAPIPDRKPTKPLNQEPIPEQPHITLAHTQRPENLNQRYAPERLTARQSKGPPNFEQDISKKLFMGQIKNSKSGGRYSTIDESDKANKMKQGLQILSMPKDQNPSDESGKDDDDQESPDKAGQSSIKIEDGSLWLNEYLGIRCKANIVNLGIKMINESEFHPKGCCIWKCDTLDRLVAKDPVQILFPDINFNNKAQNNGYMKNKNTIVIDENPLLSFVRYTKHKERRDTQLTKNRDLKAVQKEIPGEIYMVKQDHSVTFKLQNYLYDEFLAINPNYNVLQRVHGFYRLIQGLEESYLSFKKTVAYTKLEKRLEVFEDFTLKTYSMRTIFWCRKKRDVGIGSRIEG